MKKTMMAVAAMAAAVVFAGQDDLLVTLTVNETLTYADKTSVVNDRVALVWTPAGVEFQGFYADGSVADGRSKVLTFINVKDGQVGTVTFQISAAWVEAQRLTGGAYALYLLDTRGADQQPIVAQAPDGTKRVVAVNYWAKLVGTEAEGVNPVSGTVTAESAGTAADTIVAEGSASLPYDITTYRPIIKSVKIEDGMFKVTVQKSQPFMKYALADLDGKVDLQSAKSGTVEGEVTLETPLDDAGKLLTVTADRNQ